MNKAIQFNQVSFAFDERVIFKDVSLAIPQQSFVAIVGNNGVGKTTLLKLILGELLVKQGDITIQQQSVEKAIRQHQVSYISQQSLHAYQQFPTSVSEVLDVHLGYLRKMSQKEDYLAMVNLTSHQHKRLNELSGGQLQRLGILLALVQDAPILLLDEPTNNIDVQFADELYSLLKRLVERGKTVVMVTHHIHHAIPYVDYVLEVADSNCQLCESSHFHVHGRACEC